MTNFTPQNRLEGALSDVLTDHHKTIWPRFDDGSAANILNRQDCEPELLSDIATSAHADEQNKKASLLRLTFEYISRDNLYQHLNPNHLQRIERNADAWPYRRLLSEIKLLLKSIAAAKGRRGGRHGKKRDLPYWHETKSTTTKQQLNQSNIKEKEENMAIHATVPPEYKLIDRGEHNARIAHIDEPEVSKFDPDKQSVKVIFELTDGEFEGQKVSKYYSLNLSKMAGLGQLYRNLVGPVQVGEQVDLELLLGRECAVQITHKPGDDGDYAAVQDVFKLKVNA